MQQVIMGDDPFFKVMVVLRWYQPYSFACKNVFCYAHIHQMNEHQNMNVFSSNIACRVLCSKTLLYFFYSKILQYTHSQFYYMMLQYWSNSYHKQVKLSPKLKKSPSLRMLQALMTLSKLQKLQQTLYDSHSIDHPS